jgi:hypothetical protein
LAVQAAIQVLIDNPAPELDSTVDIPSDDSDITETLKEVIVATPPLTPTTTAVTPDEKADLVATTAPTDKHGRVWDARIDSSNQKLTSANEWQRRRNVDQAEYDRVVAELTGAQPPVPVAQQTPAAAKVEQLNAAAAASAVTWDQLFQKIMTANMEQRCSMDVVNAKVSEILGVPDSKLINLMEHPDQYARLLIELSL